MSVRSFANLEALTSLNSESIQCARRSVMAQLCQNLCPYDRQTCCISCSLERVQKAAKQAEMSRQESRRCAWRVQYLGEWHNYATQKVSIGRGHDLHTANGSPFLTGRFNEHPCEMIENVYSPPVCWTKDDEE